MKMGTISSASGLEWRTFCQILEHAFPSQRS
jgi:hypothetical protein